MQKMFAMGTVGSKILRTVFGLREPRNEMIVEKLRCFESFCYGTVEDLAAVLIAPPCALL